MAIIKKKYKIEINSKVFFDFNWEFNNILS